MEINEMIKNYTDVYNELVKVVGIQEDETPEKVFHTQIALLNVAAAIQQNKILCNNLQEISRGITTIVGLLAMGHIRSNDEDNPEYRQPGY